MPTPALDFQEPKSPKPGTRHDFQKYISKHIPAFMTSYKIWWENQTAILHCYCLPVQSFHNIPANFRIHASVTFLVYHDKRTLFMVFFLERLETSFLLETVWQRQFGRCTISRLNQAVPLTQNLFANGALILKLFASSFADAMFSPGNFGGSSSASCLSHMHRALSRNLHISVMCACQTPPKLASLSSSTKSFRYSQEQLKRPCLFSSFLH